MSILQRDVKFCWVYFAIRTVSSFVTYNTEFATLAVCRKSSIGGLYVFSGVLNVCAGGLKHKNSVYL